MEAAREWGGGQRLEGERLEDHTENISLLDKFFMPLSSSIVIYARDEGGYGPLYGF